MTYFLSCKMTFMYYSNYNFSVAKVKQHFSPSLVYETSLTLSYFNYLNDEKYLSCHLDSKKKSKVRSINSNITVDLFSNLRHTAYTCRSVSNSQEKFIVVPPHSVASNLKDNKFPSAA